MKKILIAIAVAFVLLVSLLLAGLFYLGTVGPDTFVVSGQQLDRRHIDVIDKLELLEESERIRYFYSDAMLDVRKGMYFVTDRKLVLYNEGWNEPQLIADFSEITDTWFVASESWLEDSYVTIDLESGDEWTFPVSAEQGKDQLFYRYLVEQTGGDPDAVPAETTRKTKTTERPSKAASSGGRESDP